MQEIVNIIEHKRQNLASQLSKDIAKVNFTNNLSFEIQNWTDVFKEGLVSCTDSINLNLGPALNNSYQSRLQDILDQIMPEIHKDMKDRS